MAKAIFEQIFDGPDSIFGHIFGPSREAIKEAAAAVRKGRSRTIRFRLTQTQIERILAGDQVTFKVGEETFIVTGGGAQ